MASLWELFVKISGDNSSFKKSVQDAGQDLDAFSSLADKLSGKLMSIAGPAAFGALFIKAAENIEQANARIERATGATGAALSGLEKSLQNVYSTSARSATEIGDVMSQLTIRTGLTGDALESLTSSVLKFATVSGSDLSSTVQTNEKLFAQWNVSTADQSEAMDVLYVASIKTGISATALSQSMLTMGPVLRAFGYSFIESAALVANFNKAGLDATDVTAGLKKAFTAWAEAGQDPKQALTDLIARMKDAKSIAAAVDLAKGDGFSAKTALQMADAVRRGALDIDGLAKSLVGVKGKVDDVAASSKTMGENFTTAVHQMALAIGSGEGASIMNWLGKGAANAATWISMFSVFGHLRQNTPSAPGVAGDPSASGTPLNAPPPGGGGGGGGGILDRFAPASMDQSKLNTLQNLINADRIHAAASAYEALAAAIAKSGLSIDGYLAKGTQDLEKLIGDAPEQVNNIVERFASTSDYVDKLVNKSMKELGESTLSVDNVMRDLGLTSTHSLQQTYDAELALSRQLQILVTQGKASMGDLTAAMETVARAHKAITSRMGEETRKQSQYIDGVAHNVSYGLGGALDRLITHSGKVSDAFKQMGRGIINSVLAPLEQKFAEMLSKWLTSLIFGESQEKQHNAQLVGSQAGPTGAAAFSSVMAALPFPLNVAAAPGVAAAEVAQMLGTFLPMAMFERGGNVPYDMPAYLHAKEMVLPADIAGPLRENLAGVKSRSGASVSFHGCSFGQNSMNQVVRELRKAKVRI